MIEGRDITLSSQDILVIITAIYTILTGVYTVGTIVNIYFSRKMLETSDRQLSTFNEQLKTSNEQLKITTETLKLSNQQLLLNYNPMIGIIFNSIDYLKLHPNPEYSGPITFNKLLIDVDITNTGNAPGIALTCDAEIILQIKEYHGEKVIPISYSTIIPFLKNGETFKKTCAADVLVDYSTKLADLIIEDCKLCVESSLHDLISHVSENMKMHCPILKIYVYYQNNLGQTFESTFESQIIVSKQRWDDKTQTLIDNDQPRIYQPIFNAKPIPRKIMETDINNREELRQKIYSD